jgi:predicted Zn finger-like uncharacterized protein
MPLSVQCPNCQKKYTVGDALAGKRVKCRHCGHVLSVPVAVDEFDPASVIVEIEQDEEDAQAAPAAMVDLRPSNSPYAFPMAGLIDGLAPWVLAAIGIAWLIHDSISNDAGPPGFAMVRAGVFLGLYLCIVWPMALLGLHVAAWRLRVRLPPFAAWRAFAAFAIPFALTCVFGQMTDDANGAVTGLLLGLVVACPTVWLLFHFRPQQAVAGLACSAGFYVGATALAAAILLVVNAIVLALFTHWGTAQHFDHSPLATALYWTHHDENHPPAPAHVLARTGPATTRGVEEAPPLRPPLNEPTLPENVTFVPPGPSAVTPSTHSSTLPATSPAPIAPSSPVVSQITLAGLGKAEGFVEPGSPSNWIGVLRTHTPREDCVELWQLLPPEQRGPQAVFHHADASEHYVISSGGDLLAHLVDWPKFGAQIWSFNDDKVLRDIELKPALGIPTLMGICDDNLIVHWRHGADCGIEIYNVRTGQRLRQMPLPPHADTQGAIALSPDGKSIAVATTLDEANRHEAQLQLLDLAGIKAIRRFAIASLDPHLPVDPTGIAFSPNGDRVALLFEHAGNALIAGWKMNETKQYYEHLFPGSSFHEDGAATFTGQPILWLPDGNAWLLYGHAVVDNESGRVIADLGIKKVSQQRLAEHDLLALECAGPAGQGAQMLLVSLDAAKLAGLETPPKIIKRPPPLTRPTTIWTKPTADN